ncbi:MAG: hypothetical protein AB4050_18630 [Synechococcus sp.]
MDEINLLRDRLRTHFPWHGARLRFIAMFLIALIRVRTVDFSQLAIAFGGNALAEFLAEGKTVSIWLED